MIDTRITKDQMIEHLNGSSNFILASLKYTEEKRWGCGPLRANIGRRIKGIKLHPDVDEAIKIELSDGSQWYMHYKDLVILDESILESKNESFLFEIENLYV